MSGEQKIDWAEQCAFLPRVPSDIYGCPPPHTPQLKATLMYDYSGKVDRTRGEARVTKPQDRRMDDRVHKTVLRVWVGERSRRLSGTEE